MDGKVYSFSIDTVGRKAAWAEYGVPLEIGHLDDLRISISAKLRLLPLPWSAHSRTMTPSSFVLTGLHLLSRVAYCVLHRRQKSQHVRRWTRCCAALQRFSHRLQAVRAR